MDREQVISTSLYDQDFHAWTQDRQNCFDTHYIDCINVFADLLILRLLEENPSLKADLETPLRQGYQNGRDLAMGETDLPESTFPQHCPYLFDQIFSESFYPGEPSDLLG